MVYKPRKARGGKAEGEMPAKEHGNLYNAKGSPAAESIDAKSDGFKRGGMAKKKRKDGGHVEGEGAKHHMGKRARGGATGSPFSAGHKVSMPTNVKSGPGDNAETVD